MRYTEARLTPIAKLLLDEIDMGTVDFQPNYDGSTEEPKLLPGRLPFVLLNGASGIAVGMATEVPSHNLQEVAKAAVALIRNPKLTHRELMEFMPGPDFPGGGQIITSAAAISEMYENRRTGARPVAGDRDRTSARHLVAKGARGNRGTDQSENQAG
jgi:topoisomerase-4 subunit A